MTLLSIPTYTLNYKKKVYLHSQFSKFLSLQPIIKYGNEKLLMLYM